MRTRRTTTIPRGLRPSKVDQLLYGGGTSGAACFPLEGGGPPEHRQKGAGTLFGRLFGLRVNLESLALRVIEGEELFYRIVLENATGGELREVRLMETWITDGHTIIAEHRTRDLPPLGPGASHLVERRASFRAGLLSIVVAVSASPPAPGVLLASDRLKRLVVRHDIETKHGYRPAA